MSDPKHPTNPEWEMKDPLVETPPANVVLLLLQRGGCLIQGPWTDDCLAWAYKPVIPQTVKDRMYAGK